MTETLRKYTMVAALGLLCFTPIIAAAQTAQDPNYTGSYVMFYSGQELHDICKHYDSGESLVEGDERDKIIGNNGICKGFILGSVQAIPVGKWSPPKEIGAKQTVAVVKKYVDNHPELWNQKAMALIWKALAEAFPPTTQ